MPSSPPPDRFQREIDDIIRLAERRLEHQSFSYRMRKSTRRLGNVFSRFHVKLPSPEVLGGWAMAMLLAAWLCSLLPGPLLVKQLSQPVLIIGVALLVLALVTSMLRGRSGGSYGGGKVWRGEHIAYASPYGESWLDKLRRVFRGR